MRIFILIAGIIISVVLIVVMNHEGKEPTVRLINPGQSIDVGQALNPAASTASSGIGPMAAALSEQTIKLSHEFFEMGVHVGYTCATHGATTKEVNEIIRAVHEGSFDRAMLLYSNFTSRVEGVK